MNIEDATKAHLLLERETRGLSVRSKHHSIYHEKPESYEEAEPEDIGATSHSRRLGVILSLITSAARHFFFSQKSSYTLPAAFNTALR